MLSFITIYGVVSLVYGVCSSGGFLDVDVAVERCTGPSFHSLLLLSFSLNPFVLYSFLFHLKLLVSWTDARKDVVRAFEGVTCRWSWFEFVSRHSAIVVFTR